MNAAQPRGGTRDFEVRRDELHKTRLSETPPGPDDPRAGELRLAVDRFGLTANNVTYGVAGDALGYWDVFPSADHGWGRVPVWGYGDVVASRVEGIEPGERFYGFLRMSSHVTLRAQPTGSGFVETSPHRAGLSRFYNRYERIVPGEQSTDEALVMRPLFATSFLLEHLLRDNEYFGADAVVLSSASSKTAYGLAFLLARKTGHPRVVGLTSEGNRQFTDSLALYDSVVTYDASQELFSGTDRFVYVDLSGDRPLRAAIHQTADDRLMHSVAVGATHWDRSRGPSPTAGPEPSFFFAPTYSERLAGELGPQELRRRIGAAWRAFAPVLQGRVEVVRGETPQAVRDAWLALVDGRADPGRSHVLSLS